MWREIPNGSIYLNIPFVMLLTHAPVSIEVPHMSRVTYLRGITFIMFSNQFMIAIIGFEHEQER